MSFTKSESCFYSRGIRCAASVYRPDLREALNAPVIVMAHGFGCVRALRLPDYAQRFAAAGYTVVVFDYRFFGDSEGEPRQLLDIPAQLDDWRAAIAWARTLDGVDSDRVVAWGTSLSGGHVITLAGTGTPLMAIIAQVPHVSGLGAVRAGGIRHGAQLLPAALEDCCRALIHRPPRYLGAIGAPGSCSIMSSKDALPAVENMAAIDGLTLQDFPTVVAARIVLRMGFYSPIRRAGAVTCPALMQVARDDVLCPASKAQQAAARMARATLKIYPAQHFEVYLPPVFDAVVTDQLTFLRSVAPVPE